MVKVNINAVVINQMEKKSRFQLKVLKINNFSWALPASFPKTFGFLRHRTQLFFTSSARNLFPSFLLYFSISVVNKTEKYLIACRALAAEINKTKTKANKQTKKNEIKIIIWHQKEGKGVQPKNGKIFGKL